MGLTTALLERTFSKRLRCCVTFSVVNTNRESSEGYAGFSPQHYGRDGRCGCPGGRGAVGGGTARLLSPASRPCRHRPPPGLTFFARTEGRGRRATAASPRLTGGAEAPMGRCAAGRDGTRRDSFPAGPPLSRRLPVSTPQIPNLPAKLWTFSRVSHRAGTVCTLCPAGSLEALLPLSASGSRNFSSIQPIKLRGGVGQQIMPPTAGVTN